MNIDTTHASPPLVSRWWILFLVHMSMLVYALNLQMIPPLLPTLITKLGLTHTQAGTLMALFTLPGIFLAIPGGRVSDTIGPRGVALWSLALLGTGALLMFPLHPAFLLTGRLCSGVGGAVIVVVAPQIIARTFYGRELGFAMGIYNTAVPLGTMTAFNLLGFFAGRLGIPVVFMATASFSFVVLAAFYLTYADTEPEHARTAVEEKFSFKGLGKGIWVVSLVWVLFNISILAYFTYSIDYFTGEGMSGATARFLGSLPMLLSVFFTPLAGFAMQRFGLRKSLITVGCAISSAAILFILISKPAMILPLSVILGAGISMVPPAVFTIAGEIVPHSRVGTGYGLVTSIFNLGVFFGIPMIGHMRDITASYSISFLFMSVIMLSGGVMAMVFTKMLSK